MLTEMQKVKKELGNVGIHINDIFDLVNTATPYPLAIPVLLKLLSEGIEDFRIKEGIIRSLAVKEAIGLASPILIEEYNRIPKDKALIRWAIGNTVYTTITNADVESVMKIIQKKENGMSRQMFVAALGKIKSEKVEDILIELLDDEEIAPHALDALGKMKSKKAKENIYELTNHPSALIRRQALKALKKIE